MTKPFRLRLVDGRKNAGQYLRAGLVLGVESDTAGRLPATRLTHDFTRLG